MCVCAMVAVVVVVLAVYVGRRWVLGILNIEREKEKEEGREKEDARSSLLSLSSQSSSSSSKQQQHRVRLPPYSMGDTITAKYCTEYPTVPSHGKKRRLPLPYLTFTRTHPKADGMKSSGVN